MRQPKAPEKVTTSPRARALRRAAARFPLMFGARLQRLRNAAGFGQPAFSRHCGIPVRSLSRYETGATMPSPPVLLLLAAGLGIEPGDLLGVSKPRRRSVKP